MLVAYRIHLGMLDRQFVFFPETMEASPWASLAGIPLQDVYFKSADGTRLHGWYLEGRSQAAPILWCHGNAGNISHRLENMLLLAERGIGFLIFDYRGYGQSSGIPNEAGLYADGQAALEQLLQLSGRSVEEVVIFGRSLGAAVAAELAANNRNVRGLVLETPFTSVKDVARHHYANLPVEKLLVSRFDVLERLPKIQCPVLVIHGTDDRIIPFELGKQVFESAREPKLLYTIPGADHNNTYTIGGKEYFDQLEQFLTRGLTQS